MLSISIRVPCGSSRRITRPHRSIAREYINGSVHCEPDVEGQAVRAQADARAPSPGAGGPRPTRCRTCAKAETGCGSPRHRAARTRPSRGRPSASLRSSPSESSANRHTPRVTAPTNVLVGLDGVAEQHVRRPNADRVERLQFEDRGDLEARPTVGQGRQHRQCRIALEGEVRPDVLSSPR